MTNVDGSDHFEIIHRVSRSEESKEQSAKESDKDEGNTYEYIISDYFDSTAKFLGQSESISFKNSIDENTPVFASATLHR